MKGFLKISAGLVLCAVIYGLFTVAAGLRTDNFSCEGFGTIYHGDFSVRATYKVLMKDGTGSFTLNGVSSRHHKDYPLSRQVYFSYITQDNLYLLQSIRVAKSAIDHGAESGAENHYPAFFSEGNRRLTIKIMEDERDNRVLYFGGVPFLYCARL